MQPWRVWARKLRVDGSADVKILLGAGVDVSAEWRPVQSSLIICSALRPIVVASMLSL